MSKFMGLFPSLSPHTSGLNQGNNLFFRTRREMNFNSKALLLHQLRKYYFDKDPQECKNRHKILRTITRMMTPGHEKYINLDELDC